MVTLLLLDKREMRLDWIEEGETCRFRVESEEERSADIRQVEPGVYSVLLGGRSYQAVVDGTSVSIGGGRFCGGGGAPRPREGGPTHPESAGRQKISSTTPRQVMH